MKRLSQSKLATGTVEAMQAFDPSLGAIPQDKMAGMVARTLLGLILGGVGLALLAALVGVPLWLAVQAKDATKISLPLVTVGLVAGLGFFAWGALTASSQLAARPLALVVGTIKGLYGTVRRKA